MEVGDVLDVVRGLFVVEVLWGRDRGRGDKIFWELCCRGREG